MCQSNIVSFFALQVDFAKDKKLKKRALACFVIKTRQLFLDATPRKIDDNVETTSHLGERRILLFFLPYLLKCGVH